MNTRSIIFENFRNLGIEDSKQENLSNKLQLGSIDREHIGGLLDLLGGNNDGKSNGLDGLVSLGEKNLCEDDIPNFIGYEDKIPKLILQYEITTQDKISAIKNVENEVDKNLQDTTSGVFAGKTFGIVLRGTVVEDYNNRQKDGQIKSSNTCQQYWQNILDSNIYAFQKDGEKLPEIRIISKDYSHICICSIDSDNRIKNSLSCVTVRYEFQKNIRQELHEDMKHAIKLGCKFQVIAEDSKTPKNCDDASLLRQFLKEDFETRTYIKDTPPPISTKKRVTLLQSNLKF